VDFESTENLFIEGDNLEVLKLLQKSYHGRVKMIYIDPPYNTGNEFIYPDNFREGIEDYLRFSGQKNGDGAKLSTNTETGGPLPLQMARHDVPAPLPRPQPAARGRRNLRQHRRPRGPQPADADG
jgi:hypothetical protein